MIASEYPNIEPPEMRGVQPFPGLSQLPGVRSTAVLWLGKRGNGKMKKKCKNAETDKTYWLRNVKFWINQAKQKGCPQIIVDGLIHSATCYTTYENEGEILHDVEHVESIR